MRALAVLLTLAALLAAPTAAAGPRLDAVTAQAGFLEGTETVEELLARATCVNGLCEPPPCPLRAVCGD